jgi:NADH:ubiquinone oxidoreductase subunit 2 (subunit N)
VLLTSVIEAVYFFRVIGALYGRDGAPAEAAAQTAYATAGSGLLAAVLVVAGLAAPQLTAPLDAVAAQMADTAGYIAHVLPAPGPTAVAGVAP